MMVQETYDPLFSIAQKDAPELAEAKARFAGAACGPARNDARVQLLRLRFDATQELIKMLQARLRLAGADLAAIRADLQHYAPDFLRELAQGEDGL